MSAPSSFITGISLIRIILCLMICAFHWARWSPVAGSVGVDWFIVLSGFLMTFTLKENSFSPPSFYISKFARLWPLLFTAILLSSLVSYKEQFQLDNLLGVLLVSFGGNQFMNLHTGDNYALWYMKLEILFVLIFPLVAYGRKRLPLLLALGLWEATAAAGYVDPFFFSRPSLLWQEFWTMLHSGMLARHLSVTAQEAGLGLLLGGTLGTLAGLGLGLSPRVSRALMPLMTGLNGLPKLALGPLFIIWFGMGLSSKVLISALMVFFIFAFNLYTGVQSVDPALVGAVRLLGGTQGQILGKVIWPACLPWLLTSLRTGLGLSLSGAIVGEYLGSTRGMGWLLSAAGDVFNAQRVLCCVLILVILIILLDGVVRLLEARLLRWR